jgi:hypothetical protein
MEERPLLAILPCQTSPGSDGKRISRLTSGRAASNSGRAIRSWRCSAFPSQSAPSGHEGTFTPTVKRGSSGRTTTRNGHSPRLLQVIRNQRATIIQLSTVDRFPNRTEYRRRRIRMRSLLPSAYPFQLWPICRDVSRRTSSLQRRPRCCGEWRPSSARRRKTWIHNRAFVPVIKEHS